MDVCALARSSGTLETGRLRPAASPTACRRLPAIAALLVPLRTRPASTATATSRPSAGASRPAHGKAASCIEVMNIASVTAEHGVQHPPSPRGLRLDFNQNIGTCAAIGMPQNTSAFCEQGEYGQALSASLGFPFLGSGGDKRTLICLLRVSAGLRGFTRPLC